MGKAESAAGIKESARPAHKTDNDSDSGSDHASFLEQTQNKRPGNTDFENVRTKTNSRASLRDL